MAYDEQEAEPQGAEGESREKPLKLSDDDFLSIVKAERRNAIGMNTGDDVVADRIQALEYFKGQMDDVPVMPNRSKSISTDVQDAVYTALPDLIEIFVSEEIGAFRPVGEEDDDAAKQETEVVNNVIMEQNPGFELVHDFLHDALLQKTGIFNFWIERKESYGSEHIENQTAMAVEAAQKQHGEGVVNVEQAGADPMLGPLYSFDVVRAKTNHCVKIKSVDPNRFWVSRDTDALRDTPYCGMQLTIRAQELKAIGFDPDQVNALPGYSANAQSETEQARDTAGENATPQGAADPTHDMRLVAINVHVVRVDAKGEGRPQIWRIATDEQDGVLLDKGELQVVPFAAGAPYRVPHRFYGRSLADLLMELQRIKTALTRLHMDGLFFSVNERHEIDMSKANEHTLSDYLNNVPGYPVRVKQGQALNPLVSARSDSKTLDSLEYFSTVGEQRTGIVRNAQGLNPDTLHDTKGGAEMLMNAAAKRLRLIARTLAETGLKDLYVGVHSLLRTSGSQQMSVRLTGGWVPVDPSSWGEREDMTIEIGMGAGGREMDLAMAGLIGGVMEKTIEGQASGAISPPVVTSENIYEYNTWLTNRAGVKKGKKFFTDPKETAAAQAQQPPQPDPEMEKAKADLALQQQKMQFDAQAQAVKIANDKAAAEGKARLDQWMAQQQADLATKKAAFEARLAEENAQREADLAVYTANLQAETAKHAAKVKAEADVHISKNRPGGDLNK